jgi:hypothetical protein
MKISRIQKDRYHFASPTLLSLDFKKLNRKNNEKKIKVLEKSVPGNRQAELDPEKNPDSIKCTKEMRKVPVPESAATLPQVNTSAAVAVAITTGTNKMRKVPESAAPLPQVNTSAAVAVATAAAPF